jgi:inhibitor of cysteine peptidase
MNKEYLVLGLIFCCCMSIAWGVTAASKDYLAGGTPDLRQTPVPSSPAYRAFSQLDNGTTVTVHSRDVITVRLPENPSTGYRWNITTGPGLDTLDDTYIYADPEGRTTGAGGVRFLTFVPAATGTEQVTAVYRRSWENDAAGTQAFSMTFVIS